MVLLSSWHNPHISLRFLSPQTNALNNLPSLIPHASLIGSQPASDPIMDDDPPRAKFLCSFGGSILPRPVDGRLRYVGGETRIFSLPRDVTFFELLSRMRDLFDAVSIIKYQQPDEDLDALVSLVNDDDVFNMMEEYDKLSATADGAGGGITRLRLFLFSSSHVTDPDIVAASQFDVDERENERRYVDALNSIVDNDTQDQSFGPPGLNQISIPMAAHSRCGGDESPTSQHSPPAVMDNMTWLPPGAMVQEKAGFPVNIGHAHNVFDERNGACEHYRVSSHRASAHVLDARGFDLRWNQPGGGNEYIGQFSGSCGDSYRMREPPPQFYGEAHGHDHGWYQGHPHQGRHRVEDPRMHITGSRMSDHYVVDGNLVNVPFGHHGNFYDGHDDGRYARPPPGSEFGGEVFHGQQAFGHGSHHHSQYGAESPYQMPPNMPPIQNTRRRGNVPVWSGTPYDMSGAMAPNGFGRSTREGSPVAQRIAVDDQIQGTWSGQNGSLNQKYYYGVDDHSARLNPNIVNQEERIIVAPDVNLGLRVEQLREENFAKQILVGPDVSTGLRVEEVKEENLAPEGTKPTEAAKIGDSSVNVGREGKDALPECWTYLPDVIASVKKTALESPEEVKARFEEDPEDKKEPSLHESETGVSKDTHSLVQS